MDFNLDEDAKELQKLASDIAKRDDWDAFAKAGLLGVCLPEDAGGAGLGAVEFAVILREVGAQAAALPAYATLALGALPIALHGSDEQRRILASVAEGRTILTGAPREPGDGVRTTAVRAGGDYILDGVKTFVPYAAEAALILVPAVTEDGIGVFLVESDAVKITAQPAANGEPLARLQLDAVRVPPTALLGAGAEAPSSAPAAIAGTLHTYATLGAVATLAGALDGALTLTTEHVKTRRQFGRALAEFQAVTMQVGDVYIAKRALDVALWAGAWRLANGLDDADEELAIAAFTACGAGLEAFYTCQHLHGGLGLDVTYPLHRYFGCALHYAHVLGGAEAALTEVAACSLI